MASRAQRIGFSVMHVVLLVGAFTAAVGMHGLWVIIPMGIVVIIATAISEQAYRDYEKQENGSG